MLPYCFVRVVVGFYPTHAPLFVGWVGAKLSPPCPTHPAPDKAGRSPSIRVGAGQGWDVGFLGQNFEEDLSHVHSV